MPVDNKAIGKLRREYPNFTPLKVAPSTVQAGGGGPEAVLPAGRQHRDPAAVHSYLYGTTDCVS